MLLALLAAIAATLGAAPVRAAQGPYAAVATRIAVKLAQRLSSQEAHVGDTFVFETTSAVAVDGYFVSSGARGHGIVLEVRPGHGPQRGELRLAARSLDLPGGDSLPVGLGPGELPSSALFERGTPFVVVSPPRPEPEAEPTEGQRSAG